MAKAVTTRWLRKFYESADLDAGATPSGGGGTRRANPAAASNPESAAAPPAPPATVPAPPTAIQPVGTVAPKRRFLHVNEYLDAARRGLTKAQAAAELGITMQGVHMAALRHGISFAKGDTVVDAAAPVREPRRIIPAEVIAQASALRAEGKTWPAISELLGFGGNSLKVAVSRSKAAGRVAVPPAPSSQIGLRPATALSLPVEEARGTALRLPPDRVNSPLLAAPTAREGITRYPNPKGGFRLSAPSLLEAAPSRDRRLSHAQQHGESST
jgi:hypothetical protein